MSDMRQKPEKWGVTIPEILLPQKLDLRQWAVIACDQFTQDRRYWERAQEAVAGSPSTLNLIFPEVFLEDDNRLGRIKDIHRSMRHYLDSGIFIDRRDCIYLERDTPFNRGRKGLVAAIDLERYDWSPQARPLIRSTEGTVAERLPPRMDIRRNAPLETPHILLLIDDEDDSLLGGLGEQAQKTAPAYQGGLMFNSGNIIGWFLDDLLRGEASAYLADKLEKLAHRALTRYGGNASEGEPFLFAVGDGNHSLASAKGIWEEYKKEHGLQVLTNDASEARRPSDEIRCRYALVEIENIYDPAIQFEPIHRVVFGMGFNETVKLLSALPAFSSRTVASRAELARLCAEPVKGNRFGIASGGNYALVETSAGGIATACLQPLLDQAVSGSAQLSIDYIHGEDELFRLAGGSGATGILLPPLQKAGFFETVARHGPLPRKSFSMGEAAEKRFYIECRRLN